MPPASPPSGRNRSAPCCIHFSKSCAIICAPTVYDNAADWFGRDWRKMAIFGCDQPFFAGWYAPGSDLELMAIRFQALIAATAMVRSDSSFSEKCVRTES